jgi:trans-aconitate 2-methyltransferase
MSDWDAARYHRISDPQLAWGRTVAARLAPVAGECILDLGCGTGRLTEEIAATPGIFVVGLDRSAAMLQEAVSRHQARTARGQTPLPIPDRGQTPNFDLSSNSAPMADRIASRGPAAAPERGQTPVLDSYSGLAYVRADGAALPFVEAFDAVFSAATFHWIPDHDRLLTSIHRALKRGGRLVAQAGGGGNLELLYGRARRLMQSPQYARFYAAWAEPCHFETVSDTETRLRRAGFQDLEASLAFAPVTFEQPETYAEFVAAVCLRHHLDRLPLEDRGAFMSRVTDEATKDEPPLTLDYWRLNISARKAGA